MEKKINNILFEIFIRITKINNLSEEIKELTKQLKSIALEEILK